MLRRLEERHAALANVPVSRLRSAPLGSSTPLLRSASLNDLRGPQENGLRDRQAERLSGLHVDDQIELCGPLHGQAARLRTFQDPVDEVRGPAVHVRVAWS